MNLLPKTARYTVQSVSEMFQAFGKSTNGGLALVEAPTSSA
jgi:hypothetical protein